MRTPPIRLLLPAVLALVAGVLGLPGAGPLSAAAAPTAAGTLVYLKGYDVYVARPDGSGERRLTTDGTAASPYRSPSGADDGTVVAARGTRVVRMDQWGTVLNSFDPPDVHDSAAQTIGGEVVHAVVSPDGSRIAYTYQHYTCPPWGSCRMRWTTAVSAATHLTSPHDLGLAFYENPSWVTDSRLVLNGVSYDSIHVVDPGAQEQFWFHDGQPSRDFHELFEPVVSRDGTAFAAVRGEGEDAHIMVSAVDGNILRGPVPSWPTPRCATTSAEGFASPSFAPDSSDLAWAEPDGVWIIESPLVCEEQPALVIPGGRAPHWTGAALQTTRPTYPPGGSGGGGGHTGSFALAAEPSVKTKGAVRAGTRLRAGSGTWSPAPSAVRYQWLRGGKPIKGATSASYRVKKADRRKRLSVRITVSRPGYADAVALSKKVKVQR